MRAKFIKEEISNILTGKSEEEIIHCKNFK